MTKITGDISMSIGYKCKYSEEMRKILKTVKVNICRKEECEVKKVDTKDFLGRKD